MKQKKKLIDWVTHHPDFRTLLPSKVKEYLSTYFRDKLESAKLNYLADPMYYEVDAIAEFRYTEGVSTSLVIELYEAALAEYNRAHPKCWDNDKQEAYRD